MTNILVSRLCNQRCSYCFAENESTAADLPPFISLAGFDQRLEYLCRSGMTQARFLGGEPTLHPQFPELVRRARQFGMQIIVFSNGFIPKASLQALEDLPDSDCSILLNITTQGASPASKAALQRRKHTLKRLGAKVQLGCNLNHRNQDINYVPGLIIDCGLKRAVRLGLAQPVLQGKNKFLPVRDYNTMGEKITQFAELAAVDGIRIEFDCGFVRCMFSEEALNQLETRNADISWKCGPILDIDVDGTAFHCFPLAGKFSTQLTPTATAGELRDMFLRETEPYQRIGIYQQCSSCQYLLSQQCSGGCIAHKLKRFTSQPFQISPLRQFSVSPEQY